MKEESNNNVKKLLSDNNSLRESSQIGVEVHKNKVKFEIFGEEVIEKNVKQSGNSGRVYLPPTWVGHKAKIVRIE